MSFSETYGREHQEKYSTPFLHPWKIIINASFSWSSRGIEAMTLRMFLEYFKRRQDLPTRSNVLAAHLGEC